jgi:hypothetical protein
MSTATSGLSAWAAALDARDPDALVQACSPEVVFHSPITTSVGFEGPEEVSDLFRSVLEVYDDLRLVGEHGDDTPRIVHLHARIGRQELDEVQIVQLDGAGRAREVTMFVRPLPGLTTLAAGIGPLLARRRSRTRAVLLAAFTRPLALMTRSGDKRLARLAR